MWTQGTDENWFIRVLNREIWVGEMVYTIFLKFRSGSTRIGEDSQPSKLVSSNNAERTIDNIEDSKQSPNQVSLSLSHKYLFCLKNYLYIYLPF